jgi:hypothetical protein
MCKAERENAEAMRSDACEEEAMQCDVMQGRKGGKRDASKETGQSEEAMRRDAR